VDAADLRTRARREAEELGPEPLERHDRALWREERRGAVVLLAALGDYDAALLRRAALDVADELSDQTARKLLLDAAADAPWKPR
jgi:hypothetical protein